MGAIFDPIDQPVSAAAHVLYAPGGEQHFARLARRLQFLAEHFERVAPLRKLQGTSSHLSSAVDTRTHPRPPNFSHRALPRRAGTNSNDLSLSAAGGQPRRDLGHHPELDRCQDRDRRADDHMHRHRGGSLEAQYPGRYQRPQADDEVQPLLPHRECRQRRDRKDRDGDTGDIGVLRDRPGIETEYPGETNRIAPRIRFATSQNFAFVQFSSQFCMTPSIGGLPCQINRMIASTV